MVLCLEVRVRISQPEYRVNEGAGSVRVCVRRDGKTTDPITVTITTSDGTATGELSGETYFHQLEES